MTKVKRSFFERLSGASKATDEYESEQPVQTVNNNFFKEEEPETQITFNSPFRENNNMEEKTLSSVEDNEGQLTIDVYQTDNDIVIKSTIAGVKPEDIDVTINNDMVTIHGERRNEEEVSEENFYYQECYWGGFSRSVILPVDVISEKAEASMKNGILTIRLPKADSNKTKRIQVRSF
jgi:HSP20 family protein